MNKPILIISPTELEIAKFRTAISEDKYSAINCVIETCGIGPAETAAKTAAAILKHSPSMVILAGIAGVYEGSAKDIGNCLLIDNEIIADMGVFYDDGFKHRFATEYTCTYAATVAGFRKVGSNSVSACAAPFVTGSEQRPIENMEGAAFFALCTAMKIPFLELRAVSNIVSASRISWNIPLATNNLSTALIQLINEINS